MKTFLLGGGKELVAWGAKWNFPQLKLIENCSKEIRLRCCLEEESRPDRQPSSSEVVFKRRKGRNAFMDGNGGWMASFTKSEPPLNFYGKSRDWVWIEPPLVSPLHLARVGNMEHGWRVFSYRKVIAIRLNLDVPFSMIQLFPRNFVFSAWLDVNMGSFASAMRYAALHNLLWARLNAEIRDPPTKHRGFIGPLFSQKRLSEIEMLVGR